jgi:hypothetical protein
VNALLPGAIPLFPEKTAISWLFHGSEGMNLAGCSCEGGAFPAQW